MELNLKCSLCHGQTYSIYKEYQKEYYQCQRCQSVLLHPNYFLTKEQEQKRYEAHNNDIEDPRYQKFVSPIVSEILLKYEPNDHEGLDFGSGTGPVISKMLDDQGYTIAQYDPFFMNDIQKLNTQYDFIACCEVMEHFHNPNKEFNLLRSLLKPGGALYCMTELYSEEINFADWYYKQDPTHVFFYHEKGLEWIKAEYNFSDLKVQGRLVVFTV